MDVFWKMESEAHREAMSRTEGFESWNPAAPGVGTNANVIECRQLSVCHSFAKRRSTKWVRRTNRSPSQTAPPFSHPTTPPTALYTLHSPPSPAHPDPRARAARARTTRRWRPARRSCTCSYTRRRSRRSSRADAVGHCRLRGPDPNRPRFLWIARRR